MNYMKILNTLTPDQCIKQAGEEIRQTLITVVKENIKADKRDLWILKTGLDAIKAYNREAAQVITEGLPLALARTKYALSLWWKHVVYHPDLTLRTYQQFLNTAPETAEELSRLLGEPVQQDIAPTPDYQRIYPEHDPYVEQMIELTQHAMSGYQEQHAAEEAAEEAKRQREEAKALKKVEREKAAAARKEAAANGEKFYHGMVCKVCNTDLRRVINSVCVCCEAARHKAHYQRKSNTENGLFFDGKPCKVCGDTQRYVSTRKCVQCSRRRKQELRARAKAQQTA
ncbi:hypothetical protein MLN87_07440 [Escherichia coli]|nr:hypothetical protein [Escherichia coli]MCN8204097.1 hypothetical protein [Escherichia coli]HAI3384519.1 hypothetical protein [Escherichia coli]HAL0004657.1 hypothetical protein [Escherichia coli]HAP1523999.1 hypothetical protein [Escherichia coli]